MAMARSVSRFSVDGEQGMFLREHRRCFDSIVAFNNELVYNGKLIPLRGEPRRGESFTMPMSYAFVTGASSRVGGSWRNVQEAQLLVDWIKRRGNGLLEFYQRKRGQKLDLESIVSIITPFVAQAAEITRQLKKAGLPDIDVGTIHSFQGAERPVILFSATYGHGDGPYAMLNRTPNLLNVAVSRAQDSFVFFGDMRILTRYRNTELLGKYLLQNPASGLRDIGFSASFPIAESETVQGVMRHRALLSLAMERVKQRLLIVSPFAKPGALDDQNLMTRMSELVARGVQVRVVVDQRSLDVAKSDAHLVESLRRSNVEVIVVPILHRSVLTFDSSLLCEGTANWFALTTDAPAGKSGETYVYRGQDHLRLITAAWAASITTSTPGMLSATA
jgi:hypothetical protein